MVNIAILTSSDNELTETIIQYFTPFKNASVSCVISNKDNNIYKRIRRYKIKSYTTKLYKKIDKLLTKHKIHYIVMVDYLDKIPPKFCKKYKYKILNYHPALLPKYSGHNMYGDIIFKSIKNNKDKITGISIYFLDEGYHTGRVIFQKEIKLDVDDNWEIIKTKTEELTKRFYPILIEKTIRETFNKLYK